MIFLDKNKSKNIGPFIEESLCCIEQQFGIHITVHDSLGILRDSKGRPLLPGRNLHRNDYCYSGRYTQPGWNKNCTRECHRECEKIMSREHCPFIKSCWKGVWELVVPVIRDETLSISLFAGVFRKASTSQPNASEKLPTKFIDLYQQLPELDESYLNELSNALQLFGLGILFYLNQENKISEKPTTRKEKIKAFIYNNAHKSIQLSDLAKELNLSPSRTSHLVKQYFNFSYQELLIQERMKRARTMLISTDSTLEEICASLSISNVFYFNRLFKKYYGFPPGKYRQSYSNS